MWRSNFRFALCMGAVASCGVPESGVEEVESTSSPILISNANESGRAATFSAGGAIDTNNEFFQSLGTNGRSCVTCHQPSDNWTVTPAHLQQRFDATGGTDPIFRTNDGSNSPVAPVSTVEERRAAYSMLLTKGLIRIEMGIPGGAEFTLSAVDDPYGYADAGHISMFRRPLPSTNLRFLSTVMWDGRETFRSSTSTDCLKLPLDPSACFASLNFDLADQSNGATLGHAQAALALTAAQQQSIVAFELQLFTAQTFDNDAKELNAAQGLGGPEQVSTEPFHFGINDVLSADYQTGAAFTPIVFKLYDAWANVPGGGTQAARRAVARGQALFNTKPITITGVKGINDDLPIPSLQGTCTTCHDSPNAGDHSVPLPLDIGVSSAALRTPDLPLYTFTCTSGPLTGQVVQTTDPGRAMISGKCKDLGRLKGPTLRGLSGRAPYFHNGSAADLGAVIDFYNQRFGIGLTTQEHNDLVAFLKTL